MLETQDLYIARYFCHAKVAFELPEKYNATYSSVDSGTPFTARWKKDFPSVDLAPGADRSHSKKKKKKYCGPCIARFCKFGEARSRQLDRLHRTTARWKDARLLQFARQPPTECRIITTFPEESSRATRPAATLQHVHPATKRRGASRENWRDVNAFPVAESEKNDVKEN